MTYLVGAKTAAAVALGAALGSVLVPTPTQARTPLGVSCSPGMHHITIQGKPGYEFCGSAKAVVHVGTRTVNYTGGFCRVVGGYFQIGIGKEALGLPPGSKPNFFGITTHKATAGPQPNAAISFAFGGNGDAVTHQTVNLAAGLKRGTFSGVTLGSHLKVSGSFTC
jgi:hypothetical protein